MTKRTNVKLTIKSREVDGERHFTDPYCRVKIDGQGFPYVVWGNEKIYLSRTSFPYDTAIIHGLWPVTIDLLEGLEELQSILANPGLTVDKLSASQLARVA